MSNKIEIPIDLPGVNEAIKEIQALQATLDGLKTLGITSGKAVDELETQIKSNTEAVKKHTDGLEALNKKNKDTEDSTKKLDASAEGIADTFGKVFEVAGKVYDGLVRIGQAAGEAEKSARALESLGNTAHQVAAATNGMISPTQTYELQQQLLRSGLRVSSEELATLARGAREHAQVLGLDTTQALSQFTDGLTQGEAGGLRKFGLTLRDNQSRAQIFEATLRQLSNEQRGNAVAARTTAEATTHFTSSVSEAGNALALFVSQETGLAGLFNNLSNWLMQASRDLTDFAQHRDAILAGGGQNDNANLRAQQSASDNYSRAVARFRLQQRAAGVQSQGNLPGADQLTVEQRNLLAFRLNALANRSGSVNELSSAGEIIRQQALQFAGVEIARQEQAVSTRDTRLAAANRTTGPRDTSNVHGVQASTSAQVAEAMLKLGLANEELRLLNVRFNILGNTLTREQELVRLQREANRTQAQTRETEEQRLNRLAQARNDLAQALTEERDRRLQLLQLVNAEAQTSAQQGLGALGALRSGQRITQTSRDALNGLEGSRTQLQLNLTSQQGRLAGLRNQLSTPDLPLTENLRIRQQIAQVLQEIAGNEQTILQINERQRQTNRESFDLRINQTNSEIATYNTAKETRLQGLRLTEQEQNALQNRAKIVRELTELERGYQDLIAQARNEGLAAKTQEERNAALGREIQLQQQRQQVVAQRRAFEREDLRNNFGGQLSAKFRETLGANTTFAERFADITTSAFTNFADASGSALLAVIEGQKDFGTAMKEMLRSILETLAKQALVESLKNVALGIGNLAIQNYPGAGLNFAAAAAWGAVGVATGLGARALGPTTQTQASAGAQTQARAQPQRVQNSNGNSNGNSGNLVLNITVNGALTNQGVEHNIVRALNRAQTRGIVPRYA